MRSPLTRVLLFSFLFSGAPAAADERPARTALRVESTPTAESITHSRPQIITGPMARFSMGIGLAANLRRGVFGDTRADATKCSNCHH